MTPDQVVTLVGSVGFPIAVAWFLLTKLSPTISKNTEALNSLKEASASLKETLQKLCDKVGLDK